MGIRTKLDGNQVLQGSYDDVRESLRMISLGGSLVPEDYDSIALTYVTAGNGLGEIQTVSYKKAGTLIATLTLTYNASNQLVGVART